MYYKCLCLICCYASSLLPGLCPAQTVYRWIDSSGRMQLTDRPPALPAEVIEIPERSTPGGSLRPGERTRLEQVERRLQAQQRAARKRQQAARKHRDRQRAECRVRRQALRHKPDAEQRKADARYLRKHCW